MTESLRQALTQPALAPLCQHFDNGTTLASNRCQRTAVFIMRYNILAGVVDITFCRPHALLNLYLARPYVSMWLAEAIHPILLPALPDRP